MVVLTRRVSWFKAALRTFEAFPDGARSICLDALTVAAEGGWGEQEAGSRAG
jgi:hypothetical protein